jgi:UDP-N-acetylglucosamine--N-acetylmuramyl-(pentapeptide) pyrophosphoryl-undecaprenol N-acetylglucosamine transferase
MAVMSAAPILARQHPGLTLVHQTGVRDLPVVAEAYTRGGLRARAVPFLDAVAREMAAADVVICRAGATTLAELAASGRPAVLIPFPGATDDHQRRNADVLARAGAAAMLEERDLTADQLADVAGKLLADLGRRTRMAEAVRAFARPDAATAIVERILALAGWPERQAA